MSKGFKKNLAVVLLIAMIFLFSSCSTSTGAIENAGVNNTHGHAVILMPDGTIVKGNYESYTIFANGRIGIRIDGVYYTTHIVNVVLIKD